MTIDNMQVKFFKAIAHPIRLKIIKKLSKNNLCVCELNDDMEFSQSNLSQHLKILKDAGVVGSKKEGLRVNYFINDKNVEKIIKLSEEIVKDYYRI